MLALVRTASQYVSQKPPYLLWTFPQINYACPELNIFCDEIIDCSCISKKSKITDNLAYCPVCEFDSESNQHIRQQITQKLYSIYHNTTLTDHRYSSVYV